MKKTNEYHKQWRDSHPENILKYRLKRNRKIEIRKQQNQIFNKILEEFGIKHREKHPQLYK